MTDTTRHSGSCDDDRATESRADFLRRLWEGRVDTDGLDDLDDLDEMVTLHLRPGRAASASLRRVRRSGRVFPDRHHRPGLDELVRVDAELPRGQGALARRAGDRDHDARRPLAWYVSPQYRRESGLQVGHRPNPATPVLFPEHP